MYTHGIYSVILLVKLIMIIMEYLVLKNILTESLKIKIIKQAFKLTLDSNIQYIINKELNKQLKLLMLQVAELSNGCK